MKGLSLTQPWATLVAIEAKRLETRSWRHHYRGKVAIHASKGFPKACQTLCETEPFKSVLAEAGIVHHSQLPTGCIIAVGTLGDTHSTSQPPLPMLQSRMAPHEFAFGDYSKGRFAWEIAGVIKLAKPVPCNGALGLWIVPPEIEKQLFP
jgi:hypothetical protein